MTFQDSQVQIFLLACSSVVVFLAGDARGYTWALGQKKHAPKALAGPPCFACRLGHDKRSFQTSSKCFQDLLSPGLVSINNQEQDESCLLYISSSAGKGLSSFPIFFDSNYEIDRSLVP